MPASTWSTYSGCSASRTSTSYIQPPTSYLQHLPPPTSSHILEVRTRSSRTCCPRFLYSTVFTTFHILQVLLIPQERAAQASAPWHHLGCRPLLFCPSRHRVRHAASTAIRQGSLQWGFVEPPALGGPPSSPPLTHDGRAQKADAIRVDRISKVGQSTSKDPSSS